MTPLLEENIMFGRKKEIMLTASVVTAIEAMRRAVEIYLGHPIELARDCKVIPGKIKIWRSSEFRDISIETSFQEIGTDHVMPLACRVELMKKPDGGTWRPCRAFPSLGTPQDSYLPLVAHWGEDGDSITTLRVASYKQSGRFWHVGSCLADRRREAMRGETLMY